LSGTGGLVCRSAAASGTATAPAGLRESRNAQRGISTFMPARLRSVHYVLADPVTNRAPPFDNSSTTCLWKSCACYIKPLMPVQFARLMQCGKER
jgi:hypothetical protein